MSESTHPSQLFDYLNGEIEGESARAVEEHVSACEECASVAALVRVFKKARFEFEAERNAPNVFTGGEALDDHPSVGELADFFYDSSRSEDSRVAGHAALCGSCAEALAQYAHAESAAAQYHPNMAASAQAPEKAWEMIRDWEESSFAKLKPAGEVLGRDLLDRLSRLVQEQSEEIKRPVPTRPGAPAGERIRVLVVSGSGEVRGIEFFERSIDSTGASVLRHAEGSERFDNKMLHVLLQYSEKEPEVISDLICRSTIRLTLQARSEERFSREDYFIVED